MNIDFTQIEERSFEPIPKGKYDAVVCGAELKESKTTPGNMYINWQFEVTQGDFTNRKIFTMTTLAKGKEWKAKAFFKALGFDVNVSNFDIEDALINAVGIDCEIDVTIKAGVGDYPDKNEVNKILDNNLWQKEETGSYL